MRLSFNVIPWKIQYINATSYCKVMMVSDLSSCSSLGLETRQRSNKYRSLSHTYKHPALLCRRLRLGCQATTRTYQPKDKPRIKICGVTNVSDAELVAKSGANFVGMIMWPKARRAVSIEISSQIADIARKHGAEPVAVFVDETFADIVNTCKSTGIKIAQLHGKESRKALQDLPAWLKVTLSLKSQACEMSCDNNVNKTKSFVFTESSWAAR